MDEIDVYADFDGVLAEDGGVDVGDLDAMLVGEGSAGKGGGFAVGGYADGGADRCSEAGPPELVLAVSRSRDHWKWTTLAELEVSWVSALATNSADGS